MTLTDVEFAKKKNIRKFDLLEKIDPQWFYHVALPCRVSLVEVSRIRHVYARDDPNAILWV